MWQSIRDDSIELHIHIRSKWIWYCYLLQQPVLPPLALMSCLHLYRSIFSLFYKSYEFKYVIWLIHKLRYHVETLFVWAVVHNLFHLHNSLHLHSFNTLLFFGRGTVIDSFSPVFITRKWHIWHEVKWIFVY